MRAVGDNIREQRARLGLTQEELAARTKFGKTRISDLERNRYRWPDTKTLVKLAEALGCSIDDLLFGPEEEYRKAVAGWPLFEILKEAIAEIQPYPEKVQWNELMAAYERAVTRATMLTKAVNEVLRAAKPNHETDAVEFAEMLIPDAQELLLKLPAPIRDLPRHGGTGQQRPQPGGADVPASDRKQLDKLERENAALKARLSETKDIARRLAHLAAGEKVPAAPRTATGPRKRR